MASSTSSQKDCLLVGSGHGICIKQTLNEWFTREAFSNVVFMCKATGRQELYKLRANGSVLAASTPFFGKLLEKCMTSEQEAMILLPDYNQAAVFYALEYMYTGVISLSASKNQIEEVRSLLNEFGLGIARQEETKGSVPDIETDSGTSSHVGEVSVEMNDSQPPLPETSRLRSHRLADDKVKNGKAVCLVGQKENIGRTVDSTSTTASSSGKKTRCWRDEPLRYDPSPQYLRQVPTKQYTRKKNAEPGPAVERIKNPTCQEKIHIAPSDVLNALPSSSIFADPEDGPSVTEDPAEKTDDPQVDGNSKRKRSKRKQSKNVHCDVCGKMVKDRWLKYHKATHEVHQYVCEKCGRSYTLRSQLNTHMRYQHGECVNDYPCPQCGKIFRKPSTLRAHVTLHTGERRYKCKYCEMRFRDTTVRKYHMRTHTGEKPNLCDVCGRSFNQKTTLVLHRRRHELRKGMNGYSADGRPCYKCEQCSAEFRCEISLIAHRSRHTGEVPVLPCSSCPRVFTTFADLRSHRLQMHGLKRYFCQPCQKQFLTNSSFNKHMRDEHGKEKRQFKPRPV